MTMQELLIQSLNISNRITGVYNIDVTTPDDITILFKNTKGVNHCVDFSIRLDGHNYVNTINFISTINKAYVRYSSLDYSQEELKKILEKVNK